MYSSTAQNYCILLSASNNIAMLWNVLLHSQSVVKASMVLTTISSFPVSVSASVSSFPLAHYHLLPKEKLTKLVIVAHIRPCSCFTTLTILYIQMHLGNNRPRPDWFLHPWNFNSNASSQLPSGKVQVVIASTVPMFRAENIC